MKRASAAVVIGLAVSACQGRIADLGGNAVHTPLAAGDDGGSIAPGVVAGAELCMTPRPPDPAADASADDAGASFAPLVGTWTGYLEGYMLAGSDVVSLVFAAQTDGTTTGTVTFGTIAAPPPPTSAGEAYPPNTPGSMGTLPFDGFPYTATQVSFDGTRLQLGIVQNELWKSWCELQTSYDWGPESPGECDCMPNWGWGGEPGGGGQSCYATNPATGAQVAATCGQLHTCNMMTCTCWAEGCSVDMTHADARLDARLSAGQFTGTFLGYNVFLTKMP